jgi:RNA polymerase sigma-70 factor, ECF subfamily
MFFNQPDIVKESTIDTELIQQIKNSDMEAFRIIFERYQPVIFRHVFFQIHQTDLAHDIVQETFIKIWEHRTSLKPQLNLLAYAFRISTNLVLDAHKHRRVREQLKEDIPPVTLSEGDHPAEALHLTLLQEQITEIINNHLGKRCREIFILSRVEGKKHQEIADLLNISIRTVENQILHALKVLRRKLERMD